MTESAETLRAERSKAEEATRSGPPPRTSNPFFGVGPITDATLDEVDARTTRFEFDAWLEATYRKRDDRGGDAGPFTTAEIGRSMHRGYPADAVLLDMMRTVHRYFRFPRQNRMAVGLGGGHSGFTVCALHLMSATDERQRVFVDTPRPESSNAGEGGFFRQSWGAQILDMHRHARQGDPSRVHFTHREGEIPPGDELARLGVTLFIGVGHETTGATTYTQGDIDNLLAWIDPDPKNHHAILDATSMLGAMPWKPATVEAVMSRCCLFMPLQKTIGGISGYFMASFTPEALAKIESNVKNPSWAIPRQLTLAAPVDPRRPLTGERTVDLGPIYDPVADRMLGGVINTYSTLAFAETTFGLLRSERRIGPVEELNRRSVENRARVDTWVAKNPILQLGVTEPERRGAAVTLLRVNDPGLPRRLHDRVIARSKQLLGYEGLTRASGRHEPGLDVARYVNAFPGTPGDYRAWIGGIRTPEDIDALLDNIAYAYQRAKLAVLDEELGEESGQAGQASGGQTAGGADRAYKVLVIDAIGLHLDAEGRPDPSEVREHIEARGGSFTNGAASSGSLPPGLHFFYQPELSTEAEILAAAPAGAYDAVIAAATIVPEACAFPEGGVRIGAGTGNMRSASWGGGNGVGGSAPLMNTPGFNSAATAQMAFKALLAVLPDLPFDTLHARVVSGDFDTGRDLANFPTEKLEGKTIAILGYGNIGRAVGRIARAFGMRVRVFARANHRPWIESEGYEYAATPEEAARGAHVLTVHTGLGPVDPKTGRFANQGLIGPSILAELAPGAVLVNFDRGEVVDADALDAALAGGRVLRAMIDADLFREAGSGARSGPMVPYLKLHERYPDRLLLLPHAAADTDHPSRVAGAKQAVDQLFDAILLRRVTNRKGDLPRGYTDAGAFVAPGMGSATRREILELAADEEAIARLRRAAETLAAFFGGLATTLEPERRGELADRHGAEAVRAGNELTALLERHGLRGPYA